MALDVALDVLRRSYGKIITVCHEKLGHLVTVLSMRDTRNLSSDSSSSKLLHRIQVPFIRG